MKINKHKHDFAWNFKNLCTIIYIVVIRCTKCVNHRRESEYYFFTWVHICVVVSYVLFKSWKDPQAHFIVAEEKAYFEKPLDLHLHVAHCVKNKYRQQRKERENVILIYARTRNNFFLHIVFAVIVGAWIHC